MESNFNRGKSNLVFDENPRPCLQDRFCRTVRLRTSCAIPQVAVSSVEKRQAGSVLAKASVADTAIEQHSHEQFRQMGCQAAQMPLCMPLSDAPHIPAIASTFLFPAAHVSNMDLGLCLYAPVGCIIAIVRMALWIVLLLVDHDGLTDSESGIQALLFLMGVQVEWQGQEKLPSERHVMVSNHVSTGDLVALYKLPRRYVHLVSTALPEQVTRVRHHRIRMQKACKEVFQNLSDSDCQYPVHLFPEGGMTNGRGMMRFSRGFMTFAHDLPVVPVALRARLPWGITTHTLTSSFAANMFWFCFSPWVRLEARVLEPQRPSGGESKARFVERVQSMIAEELGVPILDISIQQKRALLQSALQAKNSCGRRS